ncbi:MAG: glycosyltransferase [Flavisolibacter sp.]
MKIAAVVILYHPDENTVENILSYSSSVTKVYIADNTEIPVAKIIDSITSAIPDCVYIHDGNNNGIAARLNEVCRRAKADGFDFILTMDQDSAFDDGVIANYFRCFDEFSDKKRVSMFGVQYENPQWVSALCHPVAWTTLITSGSLVNLGLFEQTGGFDENLFIDTVDFEYCYRSIQKRFKIILFKNILLTHHLGTKSLDDTSSNKTQVSYSLHSPIRLYYMIRNYLYLRARYKDFFPTEMLRSRNAVLNRVKINLMHNTNKLSIMRFALQAVLDFKRDRMGKFRKK